MTLIHTQIAGKGAIRSGVLADGRIQHTRIYNHQGGIDIVNVYWTASNRREKRCGTLLPNAWIAYLLVIRCWSAGT